MKVHVLPPRAAAGTPGQVAMQPIQALDLTATPEHRALWKARTPGVVPPVGLPPTGTASPMGYWLIGASEAGAPASGALRITFAPIGENRPAPTPEAASSTRRGRPAQTVKLKSPVAGEGDLVLTLGPAGAQVAASEAAWLTLSEPVLLVICQYWRFRAIDAEIDRLTDLAHGDLDHATMPGASSLRDRERLIAGGRAARALMLDLPYFEGPLTDALPYCSSERSAQAYETLAERLDLEDWCELIDERAEAIEDAYEAVTEKLFEYRNFAWEAILEVIIIVILVAELAVQSWEAFAP